MSLNTDYTPYFNYVHNNHGAALAGVLDIRCRASQPGPREENQGT
jgi:hypothetical protein